MWSACDNNLYDCCVNDLDKSEAGTNEDIHVLAQVDHRQNPDPAGPHTVQRLELQKDNLPGLHSPVQTDFGDANMACPKNLADFIEWGVKNYPAEHYWLVVSDHGDAWKGAAEDEGHHAWMSLPQIESALKTARDKTGRKLDVLSFDCCHMASMEVAHQLKDEARYLVASEEEMGEVGLPYDTLLPELGPLQPKDLAERLVAVSTADHEDIPTFSAVALDQVPALSESVKKLGETIAQSSLTGPELRAIVKNTQAYWEYRDLHHLAGNLAEFGNEDLRAAAGAVQESLQQAVVAEQHADTHPHSHGLQIEVQRDSERLRQHRYGQAAVNRLDLRPWRTEQGSYGETAFARDTGWAKAIEKIQS